MDRMDWPEAMYYRGSKTKDPVKTDANEVCVGAVRSPSVRDVVSGDADSKRTNHDELAKVMQKYWGILKNPHAERVKAFLKGCRADVVVRNGNSYKYYRLGDGPTVVLVHGLHSNLGTMVPIAEDLVSQGFGVVLFDAPAHGEAIGTTTDPIEVRDVIRKIGQRLGEIHAIIWHSLGGAWALYAWNDDFHAKTLVSISSPATYRFIVDSFVQMLRLRKELAEGVVKELEGNFGKAVWHEMSPAEVVKTIGVPGLIIHGKNDESVPPAHAEEIHSNWRNSRVEIVEGAGHLDVLRSLEVRGLVTRYLRESL
jgi:pimeloyl-ACP methyl ester carboxylesterase